jgi:hypothetical protein
MVFCHQLLYDELANNIALLLGTWIRPKPDEFEAALAHIQSFDARIDLFSQLANLHFSTKAMRRRIKSITTKLDAVNSHRNNIIHGRWNYIPTRTLIVDRQKPRSEKYDWKTHRYTATQIEMLAVKMWGLYQRLLKFEDLLTKPQKIRE